MIDSQILGLVVIGGEELEEEQVCIAQTNWTSIS
jgi:hypothetical protein